MSHIEKLKAEWGITEARNPDELGYKISVEGDPAGKRFDVIAYDRFGKQAGEANIRHHDTHLTADNVHVLPTHRRKGLATHMYKAAEKATGKKIAPSVAQTPEGEKLWNQPERSFGN